MNVILNVAQRSRRIFAKILHFVQDDNNVGLLRWLCLLAMTGSLAACSPTEQSFQAGNVPAQLADKELHTDDGTALPLRSWLPKGKPKAVIIALHGFNDYSNAFTGTGKYFSAHGMAVLAYDQRGFGKGPNPGIWGNEQNLTHDLEQCVRQAKNRWPKTPVYVMGESMGGAVTIVAVTQPDFPKVNGVILLAPAVWGAQTMSDFYRAALWVASHTMPGYHLTGSDLHILASNNIPMLERLSVDPLVIKHTRIDAIAGLVQLMDSAYDDVPKVQVPVMLLYGGKDQVIPSPAIDAARERFTAPMTYQFYPDGYHMLTRDLQGEEVMGDIRGWVTRHSRVGGNPFAKDNNSLKSE